MLVVVLFESLQTVLHRRVLFQLCLLGTECVVAQGKSLIASDCRASKGRMSFAGCDDLVVDEGTADMVAVMPSQSCRGIDRVRKYDLVIGPRREECRSVVGRYVQGRQLDTLPMLQSTSSYM